MKKSRLVTSVLLLLSTLVAGAQESTSVFNFLSLPSSAHTTALGGNNISLIEDDGALALQNPALLASVSNNAINLNFLTYMKGVKAGGASFTRIAGERGTWGVATQFVGYGRMTETTETGEVLGDMRALDMCISGRYSYNLSDRWVGGAAGKFIYSKYADFSSVALAVDLGLNYYDEEKDFSFSTVAANLGGQVKAFGNHHERLPFNLQMGVTKGLGHAPIRINLTMVDLTRWNKKYYYSPNKSPKAGSILMNHFCVGVDVTPMDMFYISAGYNFRRAYEMKAAGGSHAAGLSAGAGITLKRIKVGLSIAKYHVSAPAFGISLSYNL